MPNRYAKPPIIEAVCDIRFHSTSSWDLAIPGLFSERFKTSYPTRRQSAAVDLAISGANDETEQVLSRQDRLQLFDPSEREVLQIGPNLLAVNRLAPYQSWHELEPKIMEAFKAYLDIANPNGISRIGLKAVNLIHIPRTMIALEDYFDFYPHLGPRLPQTINPFLVGVEIGYEGERDRLRLELQSAMSSSTEITSLLLMLDYYCQGLRKIKFDDVLQWLQNAHRSLDDVFEGCLKDPLREIFEPVGVPG